MMQGMRIPISVLMDIGALILLSEELPGIVFTFQQTDL